MEYNFKNLVFEGGGVKGIAYVGALDELNKRGILPNIERVGGASAGAINALLIGLNFSSARIHEILYNLDFNDFLDGSDSVLKNTLRLVEKYGWYKGDFFRSWISELIKEKTGNSESTFKDIQLMKEKKDFKDLYFLGTDLSTGYSEIYSHEKNEDMIVADAVRISMSIPLFFAAVKKSNHDICVDGGLLANYPIKLFDREKYVDKNKRETEYYKKRNIKNKGDESKISDYVYNSETLGFRLDTLEEIGVLHDHNEPIHYPIDGFGIYIKRLISTIFDAQMNNHLHSDDWYRTIYIDSLDVKTTEFNLSDEKKHELIESGKTYTIKYFDWYDNDIKNLYNRHVK